MLRALLAHPLTRQIDIDDPRTTVLRRQIIESKPFLLRVYDEWYRLLAADMPVGNGPVLELGSGAGFLKKYLPHLLTSEIFACPGMDVVLDGQQMPFADASLRGIVMTDVFHHIPHARRFLAEAGRCVGGGGVIAMIEPWVSAWSKFVYRRLHHEPFEINAPSWEFPSTGPLSGANGALPWIVFERDRDAFEREFSQWKIERIKPLMPIAYVLSGGVSLRSLMPGWSYGPWRRVEGIFDRYNKSLAMFAHIVLRRM